LVVLSIFTARIGPFGLPIRPARSEGSVGVGVGVGDADSDGDCEGAASSFFGSGSEEQAPRSRAAPSRAARVRDITARR
jgi:hypothetical protein